MLKVTGRGKATLGDPTLQTAQSPSSWACCTRWEELYTTKNSENRFQRAKDGWGMGRWEGTFVPSQFLRPKSFPFKHSSPSRESPPPRACLGFLLAFITVFCSCLLRWLLLNLNPQASSPGPSLQLKIKSIHQQMLQD
jgi:hypothetical protein